jgi:hypothetical protein
MELIGGMTRNFRRGAAKFRGVPSKDLDSVEKSRRGDKISGHVANQLDEVARFLVMWQTSWTKWRDSWSPVTPDRRSGEKS